jgi:predicted metal-dependent peptidase
VAQLIEDILHPKLDWAVLLRHFVEQSTRNDYSWLPPSRRYLFQGIYLPSLHSKELGRIVIAVDTSGSIDTAALAQFSAEVSAVLEQYDTVIDVVYCDTKIQGHEQIDREDLPLKLNPLVAEARISGPCLSGLSNKVLRAVLPGLFNRPGMQSVR